MENVNVKKNSECTSNTCAICGSSTDVNTFKGKCICNECIKGIGKL